LHQHQNHRVSARDLSETCTHIKTDTPFAELLGEVRVQHPRVFA
jgi:hypothetical protein